MVIKIISKLLNATKYMHEIGICHRDLTPNNILVSESIFYLNS